MDERATNNIRSFYYYKINNLYSSILFQAGEQQFPSLGDRRSIEAL